LHLFIVAVLAAFLSGCAQKTDATYVIEDIKKYPQDMHSYDVDFKGIDAEFIQSRSEEFKKRYFKPWNIDTPSISAQDAQWGLMYANLNTYANNYVPHSKKFYEHVEKNANFQAYASENLKAITIQNSDIKVFPTNKQIFFDPKQAGEGFPFDYNQNSGIKINTPVFISHFSLDKRWAFIQSGYTFGWVEYKDLALVDTKIIDTFKLSPLFIAIKDNFALYKKGLFRENIKLGTIFAKTQAGNYFVLNRYDNMQAYIQTVGIDETKIAPFPLELNAQNFQLGVNALMDEAYGWGESFEQRDCSAMTKDLYALFGIYLDRNSYGQTKNGKYIDIKGLSHEEKIAVIKNNAKPYVSLLYSKGHVTVYLGVHQDTVLIFHNFWGITLNNGGGEERFIVGKSAITSLKPGNELSQYDVEKNLLEKIEGIVVLDSY
jgi:hypothetical protein